jgi:hypothetical protein
VREIFSKKGSLQGEGNRSLGAPLATRRSLAQPHSMFGSSGPGAGIFWCPKSSIKKGGQIKQGRLTTGKLKLDVSHAFCC